MKPEGAIQECAAQEGSISTVLLSYLSKTRVTSPSAFTPLRSASAARGQGCPSAPYIAIVRSGLWAPNARAAALYTTTVQVNARSTSPGFGASMEPPRLARESCCPAHPVLATDSTTTRFWLRSSAMTRPSGRGRVTENTLVLGGFIAWSAFFVLEKAYVRSRVWPTGPTGILSMVTSSSTTALLGMVLVSYEVATSMGSPFASQSHSSRPSSSSTSAFPAKNTPAPPISTSGTVAKAIRAWSADA
mmetsp:Transcript_10643/g.65621  ORF Transcript_10643/g.65621 Transcript_10643/m.65621 type:complete len:246 (-) Transcript_10643:185-922(-)